MICHWKHSHHEFVFSSSSSSSNDKAAHTRICFSKSSKGLCADGHKTISTGLNSPILIIVWTYKFYSINSDESFNLKSSWRKSEVCVHCTTIYTHKWSRHRSVLEWRRRRRSKCVCCCTVDELEWSHSVYIVQEAENDGISFVWFVLFCFFLVVTGSNKTRE